MIFRLCINILLCDVSVNGFFLILHVFIKFLCYLPKCKLNKHTKFEVMLFVCGGLYNIY